MGADDVRARGEDIRVPEREFLLVLSSLPSAGSAELKVPAICADDPARDDATVCG